MKQKHLINVITLGCNKNTVDSEYIMGQLEMNGMQVVYDSDSAEAKTVIINTCGFIGDAKQESIDTILSFARAKQEGLIEHLYVIGCLSQRYKEELREEIPEVDEIFGVRDLSEVVLALGGQWFSGPQCIRKLSTPRHYAFLKISEGCDRTCGYCAIPLIRGKHISVPIEVLVEEAKTLSRRGVKELIVIAQDTTYYGIDIYGKRRIAELMSELCKVEGIEWIRLHYAYPSGFPDELIDVMASEPKICKYLDIPFQHISDSQLRAMRRGGSSAQNYELIDKLRSRIPDIALRTTLLVGYPNEARKDFEELKRFVSSVKFDRLGAFTYSEEEGTHSANELEDNVPTRTKKRRLDRIMEIQREISIASNDKYVNRVLKVIIDGKQDDFYLARTEYDSPEVDQQVWVVSDKKLSVGEFYMVEITSADEYDLYARTV